MDMMTPVRAETFENLVFDAGLLLRNFDYSSATDAESLAALIKEAKKDSTKLLGATKGGINPQTNFEFWEPELDGKRMSFKGAKRLSNGDAVISGTLVEMTPENAKDVIALADIGGEGNKRFVQPRFSIDAGDYIDSLVWISNLGSDGLYLAELKNALCISGLSTQTTDKDIGTLPFEFHGHADDVNDTKLPIIYWFFRSSTAAAANTIDQAQPAATGDEPTE